MIKNKKRVFKNIKEVSMMVAVSGLCAGLVTYGAGGYNSTKLQTLIDYAKLTPECVDYVHNQSIELYNLYKNGDITAKEYHDRRLAISTYEELLANSNKFSSGDLYEEVEQLKVNKDKNNKITLGFAGASIAGMVGTAIGAIGQAVVKDKGEKEEQEPESEM